MPTKRFGKVRRMLRDGRAVCVKRKPFTIRLTYETTSYTQEVISGTDGGRTNIGNACVLESGECLYRDRVETRNRKIPKLMKERREHRQASRRGERLARKRLAKKNGTIMKGGEVSRILPGYEKPVVVKDILNTPAKFNHRVRPEGWLTPTAEKELLLMSKGEKKKHAGTSVWNQVFPHYLAEMERLYPGQVYLTNGWETKKYREDHQLDKDHDIDAYAIACSILENQSLMDAGDQPYLIRQFRRHDRARIYAQKQRTYYLGKEKAAVNRRRATAQKETPPSLDEWYREQRREHGEIEARRLLSSLTVRKSTRSYNNVKRQMPGALFEYEGRTFVLASQKNHGTQFKGIGMSRYVSASKCRILRRNTGLVYL